MMAILYETSRGNFVIRDPRDKPKKYRRSYVIGAPPYPHWVRRALFRLERTRDFDFWLRGVREYDPEAEKRYREACRRWLPKWAAELSCGEKFSLRGRPIP